MITEEFHRSIAGEKWRGVGVGVFSRVLSIFKGLKVHWTVQKSFWHCKETGRDFTFLVNFQIYFTSHKKVQATERNHLSQPGSK